LCRLAFCLSAKHGVTTHFKESGETMKLRFQFRLRTLLIGVALFAVPCAYIGWQKKIVLERKEMLAQITAGGGSVMLVPSTAGVIFYPIVNRNGTPVRYQAIPTVRRWLGDQYVVDITPPAGMEREGVAQIAALFPEVVTWQR
jgi:hypothetical protein